MKTHVVLTDKEYLAPDEIKVGVLDFSLMGKPVLKSFTWEGETYEWKCLTIIPKDCIGEICSASIYKRI